ELAAKASHVDAERVVGNAGGRPPDGREQLPMRPDRARLPDQPGEQGKFGWGQVNDLSLLLNGAGFEIDGNVSPTRGPGVPISLFAPQLRSGAGEKLRDAEWLGHVVVGA